MYMYIHLHMYVGRVRVAFMVHIATDTLTYEPTFTQPRSRFLFLVGPRNGNAITCGKHHRLIPDKT